MDGSGSGRRRHSAAREATADFLVLDVRHCYRETKSKLKMSADMMQRPSHFGSAADTETGWTNPGVGLRDEPILVEACEVLDLRQIRLRGLLAGAASVVHLK